MLSYYIVNTRSFCTPPSDAVWCVRTAGIQAHRGSVNSENMEHRNQAPVEPGRATRAELARVFESMTDSFFALDSQWRFVYVNREMERSVGKNRSELLGKNLWDVFPSERELIFQQQYASAMTEKKPVEFEGYAPSLDRWFEVRAYPSEAGGITVFFRDISERKQLRAQLEASERRFRTTFDHAAMGIANVDLSGNWIDVNQKYCDILGYTRQEMLTLSFRELTHPKDIPENVQYFEGLKRREFDQYAVEKRYIHKKGHDVWVNLTVSLVTTGDGTPLHAIAIAEDITERKRAEEALRESEARFRTLFANIPLSAALIDPHSLKFLHFNDAAAQNLEYSRGEFAELTVYDIEAAMSHEDLSNMEFRRDPNQYVSFSTKHRTKSGKVRDIVVHIRPTVILGQVVNICVWVDVTESKRLENTLRDREQQLSTVLDALPVGVVIADADGKLIRANPAAERLWATSFPITDVTDYGEFEGYWPGTQERLSAEEWALARALGGEPVLSEEVEIVAFDGTRKTMLNNAMPIRDAEGNVVGAVTVNIDLTDRKREEQLLIRTEKLASAGRMAATVAHEINNPLEAVMNCVFLALQDEAVQGPSRNTLEVAQQELRRVAHITRQTLGFYREAGEPESVNLPDVVGSVLELYTPKLAAKSIRIDRKYDSNADCIAIRGEMHQVISNLITNAFEALPHSGGVLKLRTRKTKSIHGTPMIMFTIADNGAGMDRATRKRIFEPFFTTKEAYGTGLGLWVTRGIIKKHNGRICVRTKPGKGTVFTMWLPAVPE